MQKEFSIEFIKEICKRYQGGESVLPLRKAFSFDDKEGCVITAMDIANSDILLEYKYWFFCYNIFSKEQNQKIAIQLMEAILPIFEREYPNDLRPRKAIEATKLYIAGGIRFDELKEAGSGAHTAGRSIYSTNSSAACIAYAADYATHFVWYNTHHSISAVYSVAISVDANASQKILIDFINNN